MFSSPTHRVVEAYQETSEGPPLCYVVGVDLGKSQDFTALAVDQVSEFEIRSMERTTFEPFAIAVRTEKTVLHRVRNVARLPAGTSYPDIFRAVQGVMGQLEASRRGNQLVVDATGVGRPVVDGMEDAGMKPVAVTITGGREVHQVGARDFTVPKRLLASTLDIAFHQDRLQITKDAQHSEVLRGELATFSSKVSVGGTETFEHWRESQHDDLVLAVAMAVWRGENLPIVAQLMPFGLHRRSPN